MGFNRRKGISAVAAIMILVVLSVVVFLAPIYRGVTFWLGYSFAILATLLTACTFMFVSDAENRSQTFLRTSVGAAAWIYFVIQMAVSIAQIVSFFTPYIIALIVNSVITIIFVIILLSTKLAAEEIERQDIETAKKVEYIKELQLVLSTVKSDDSELARKIERLREDVKFSDPMSHSELAEAEGEILAKVNELKLIVSDPAEGTKAIEEIGDMLKMRNERCKMLKNKSEPKPEKKDNRGVKYVGVALGVVALLAGIALTTVFFILPNVKYNEAKDLFNEKKYVESIVAFERVSGFRDSDEMIEKAKTALKDEVYDHAKELLDAGEYASAIEVFEELDGYRDSGKKIEEIKETVRNDIYNAAEKYFNEQNYVEALKLYTELGDYNDSVQKIEEINNKLSDDKNVFYFGSFRGEPIAWRIVDVDDELYTFITVDSLVELAYNDSLANVEWKDATLNKWLNGEFLDSFTDAQKEEIRTVDIDGSDAKVYLMNQNDVERIDNAQILANGGDWWLRTKNGTKAMYVDGNGKLVEDGDEVVRAIGVRPCIQIKMK